MKKYIHHIILLWTVAAGCLTACSFLDVDLPDNLVKNDYWQSKEQVKAALTGIYTSLHNNLTQLIEWGDLRSEICNYGTKGNLGDLVELVNQDISTANSLNNWATVYQSINWINSFLKNARSTMAKDPTITEEEMASWESEAYALRALYYFYLVRTFKDVPIILEAYESDTQTPYAAPAGEKIVLDTIEADLRRASAHAPENFTDPLENYGRITQNATNAIWADVKLWRGDYDGCLALCEKLDHIYGDKLVKGTDWYSIFSQGNSSESIFEYQYLNNKGISSPLFNLYYNGTNNILRGNYEYLMERLGQLLPSEIDGYELSDTVRILQATISPTGEIVKYLLSTPYAMPLQYRGIDSRDANFIFYRYKEILLIEAEAWGLKEKYDEAIGCINKIRTATNLPLIENTSDYGEGETFFQNLLDERMAELGYEGKHWFSQIRMARNSGFESLVIERNAQAAQYILTNVKPQTMRARLLEPESWFLPYYKTEVEKNPLLNQKTYYEGK